MSKAFEIFNTDRLLDLTYQLRHNGVSSTVKSSVSLPHVQHSFCLSSILSIKNWNEIQFLTNSNLLFWKFLSLVQSDFFFLLFLAYRASWKANEFILPSLIRSERLTQLYLQDNRRNISFPLPMASELSTRQAVAATAPQCFSRKFTHPHTYRGTHTIPSHACQCSPTQPVTSLWACNTLALDVPQLLPRWQQIGAGLAICLVRRVEAAAGAS